MTLSRVASSDPNLGRVLRCRYRLESKLGEGGMGVVYRGLQLPINRPVAVKLMLPGPPGEHFMREQRFRREAEATASLREEHTVRVFDYGVTEQREPFLIMELLQGEDLQQHLQKAGRLDPDSALKYGRQILLGLAEAHALGITHRDLKPSNVFLSRRHTGEICVKVVDFGIARFDARRSTVKLTHQGALVGTPGYMPPEQLQGQNVDARGDLYSFGVLLFELLTGRLPFGANPTPSLWQAHISSPPPRLQTLVPELPALPSLQAFLDCLLAKRPQDRFVDCAAAQCALRQVRRELRRGTPSFSFVSKHVAVEVASPSARRHGASQPDRVVVRFGSLVVLVLLLLLLALVWLLGRREKNAQIERQSGSQSTGVDQ